MNATALRIADEHWYQIGTSANELARSSIGRVAVARPQLSSPTVVHRSKWARTTIDRLIALAPLRDNWDQRGSAAVREDVLTFAWNVLTQIMPEDGKPPVIVPLGNGGIQLEWSSDSADLEIEVTRPFQISALLFEHRGDNDIEIELPTETCDRLTDVVREHFRIA